ncbi:dihydrofolate reductase family protein [Nocardia brasiliensis]|uniref:dihydrofolate reductase family protein n=1 Tax=Nocardia brasiliensis TaxID=37326 RepID=UPI001895EDB8|nr:dihydrofolate reductase family protein [Nocardia brasiliensis]MBF6126134.1 dihydrofolate reductase family protein [Nocardia brasiliensis]
MPAPLVNGLPKPVLSSDPQVALPWQPARRIGGNLAAEIDELKYEGDKPIIVFAGVRTAQEFLRQDAVDELRLLVFPVSRGAGRRLFGGVPARRLHLIDAEPFPKSGVLLQARPPPDHRPASNRRAMPQALGVGDLPAAPPLIASFRDAASCGRQ